jgi:hypothetical protein
LKSAIAGSFRRKIINQKIKVSFENTLAETQEVGEEAEADSGDETASDDEEADRADAEDEEVRKPAEDNEELARGTSPGRGSSKARISAVKSWNTLQRMKLPFVTLLRFAFLDSSYLMAHMTSLNFIVSLAKLQET